MKMILLILWLIEFNLDKQYLSREIQILNELKSERVVRYINTMIDNNNILYIQMEFCWNNLENILKYKHKVFKREKNERMEELEYFISCKIFIELIEALNYLHEQNPPIIHRDVKPANILFSDEGLTTGIFFKLCDFGLAKLYDGKSNTIGMGSQKYMAPEVNDGNYDTKVDIYSLGVVLHELFDIGNNLNRSDKLDDYFNEIENLVDNMRKMSHRRISNCKHIIDGKDKWCLPFILSTDCEYNDSSECQSLNVYIKYHLDSVQSTQQMSEHGENKSERSAKKLKLI